jgi:ribokinase
MSNIVVVGSINMDVVARTHHLPNPGETVFGHALHFIPGGKGANQAVAAARLGGAVRLCGKLGNDAFGAQLQAFLATENLDLTHVTTTPHAPSGTALIAVADDSENCIVVVPGSNAHLSPADVAHVPIAQGDLVLSVFEVPQAAIRAAFMRAKRVGARTLLNPAPAAAFSDALLPMVDILIVNETELAHYTNTPQAPDRLEDMQRLANRLQIRPDQAIIVTVGARGVLVLADDQWLHLPAQPVEAVDTTGAGDCFCGALAVALSEGRALPEAVRFANAAAGLSVQKLGASASMPTRTALDDFLTQEPPG